MYTQPTKHLIQSITTLPFEPLPITITHSQPTHTLTEPLPQQPPLKHPQLTTILLATIIHYPTSNQKSRINIKTTYYIVTVQLIIRAIYC